MKKIENIINKTKEYNIARIDLIGYEMYLEKEALRDETIKGRKNEFVRSALASINNGIGAICSVNMHEELTADYIRNKANNILEGYKELIKLATLLESKRNGK